MSMKKKALMGASYVLVAAMAIGGTVAYLTDTDSDVNVMTMGNVNIEQNEQQRVKDDEGDYTADLEVFEQGQVMLPYVTLGSTTKEDVTVGDWTVQMRDESVQNYVDKIVTVENTGLTDAYVRTIIAVPAALENEDASKNIVHWNGVSNSDTKTENGWYWNVNNNSEWGAPIYATTEIEGVKYNLYVATNVNKLAPGKETAPNLVGVYLDSKVDCVDGKYYYDGKLIDYDFSEGVKILVATQAVQASGFKSADEALDAAFNEITAENHPWTKKRVVVNNESDLVTAKGGIVVEEDMTLKEATTTLENEIDIVMMANITANRSDQSGADKLSALTVNGKATLEGSGTLENQGGYAISMRSDKSELTINGGTYIGGTTAVNVVKGDLVINGGTFIDTNENDNGHYLINCIDGNYRNGSATVTIKGGTFKNWNPKNNTSEGAGTDFVASGYEVVETKDGNDVWYTVVKAD